MLGLPCSNDVVNPGRVDPEDMAIEEEYGAQCLTLSRGRDLLVDGEMGEEAVDTLGADVARMSSVEGEEPPGPAEIRLLGSDRVMADTNGLFHLLEQGWSFGLSGGGAAFVAHGVNRV